ncbi:hypothetical protein FN846DRAFT_896305 [Sphaerosporella brunnea]|uniref:Uncharacterized protein n=1 Tax=Sphaerosporella brunnea TaxID=1250544 RepID=A0A5J5EDJ1_9PEZI|nr:hypothetical protein FN846DRAFT_896305 [Sphaerosporella brunnea]
MSMENSATANKYVHPSLAGIASAVPESAAQKKRGRPAKTTLRGAGEDTMVATTRQATCNSEAAATRRNPGRLRKPSMTAAPTISLAALHGHAPRAELPSLIVVLKVRTVGAGVAGDISGAVVSEQMEATAVATGTVPVVGTTAPRRKRGRPRKAQALQ